MRHILSVKLIYCLFRGGEMLVSRITQLNNTYTMCASSSRTLLNKLLITWQLINAFSAWTNGQHLSPVGVLWGFSTVFDNLDPKGQEKFWWTLCKYGELPVFGPGTWTHKNGPNANLKIQFKQI